MPDEEEPALVEEAIEARATPQGLNLVHDTLARFWTHVDAHGNPAPDATARGEFATAVGEIAANIIRHAYDDRADGRYHLRFLLFSGRVEARFHDWGGEFHESDRPGLDPDAALLDIPEGGYGLLLARAMLDALEYDRAGGCENHWRLVKFHRS